MLITDPSLELEMQHAGPNDGGGAGVRRPEGWREATAPRRTPRRHAQAAPVTMVGNLRSEYRQPSFGQCQNEGRKPVRSFRSLLTSLLSSARLLGTVLALCIRIGDCLPQRRTLSDPATLGDHTLRDIGLDRMHLLYGHHRILFQNDVRQAVCDQRGSHPGDVAPMRLWRWDSEGEVMLNLSNNAKAVRRCSR